MWSRASLIVFIGGALLAAGAFGQVEAPTSAVAQVDAAAANALPKGYVTLAAVIGGVVAMLGGVWLVFARLREKQQGFGPNSLKALGLVLFLPTLLIVGIVVPGFQAETLAALLGTVAGYVLSHSKAEDN
jgi:hypothetical protein